MMLPIICLNPKSGSVEKLYAMLHSGIERLLTHLGIANSIKTIFEFDKRLKHLRSTEMRKFLKGLKAKKDAIKIRWR